MLLLHADFSPWPTKRITTANNNIVLNTTSTNFPDTSHSFENKILLKKTIKALRWASFIDQVLALSVVDWFSTYLFSFTWISRIWICILTPLCNLHLLLSCPQEWIIINISPPRSSGMDAFASSRLWLLPHFWGLQLGHLPWWLPPLQSPNPGLALPRVKELEELEVVDLLVSSFLSSSR